MKFLTLSLLCMMGGGLGQQPTDTYPHQAVLDAGGKIKLYWKFNSTYITFELHGNTTGWIGMGISPNGGMISADIYVGWVKNGVAQITDRHGDSATNTFPPLDAAQNVKLLGGSECNGWTILTFQRQIAACDGTDDITITTSTQKIIWAMGQNDPTGSDIIPSDYHGNTAEDRGTKSLLLLEGGSVSSLPPDEPVQSFDLLNDDFSLPSVETHYSCRLLQFPDLNSKHQIVKIEPVIQKGNEANVHHIIVYQCDYDTLQNSSLLNTELECYGPNMPPDFQSCSKIVHAWAIGGEDFYYPDKVGLPIGTMDGPKYVVMETHYDNPTASSDIVDNSGLRMTYTSQPRQYDAGVLEVGHTVLSFLQLIPPKADSFKQYAQCDGSCLAAGMDVVGLSNIKLFGTMLHTHLLGEEITLRHIGSDGKELPYIAQDLSYDFNYQETKIFSEEIDFNSGDSMQIICNYNSKSKTEFTYGGLGTSEEMCLAFVFYYPKIPIVRCESFPLPDQLYGYFGASTFDYSGPPSTFGYPDFVLLTIPGDPPNQITLPSVVNSLNWDQELAKNFSDSTLLMWKVFSCENTTATNLEIPQYGPPLNITQVYTPPTPTCIQPNTGMPTSFSSNVCPMDATSTPTMTTRSGAPQVAMQSIVLMTMALVTMAITKA